MLYLLLLCLSLVNVYSLDYTTIHRGHLTFYGAGADSGGTCMYNNPRHDLGSTIPTIAIGNFGNAEKCGTCVEISPLGTGSGVSDFPTRKTFIAYVNNQCPECGEDNLDLAEQGDGVWDISWRFVECPVTGPIQLQLKTGSSKWHTEISARNFRVAIKSIEYEINGQWINLERKPYNYFYFNREVSLPVNVRLTSLLGEQASLSLTSSDYYLIESALIPTAIQFSGLGISPPPPPPSDPIPPPPSDPVPPPPTDPVPPPPSSGCSFVEATTNDWWVEVTTSSGSTTNNIYLVCGDGSTHNNCAYNEGMKKYICQGKECKAPRQAYVNGDCCTCTPPPTDPVPPPPTDPVPPPPTDPVPPPPTDPVPPPPTDPVCEYGEGTNDWWVELTTPSGSTSEDITLVCGDGSTHNNCAYNEGMKKYICQGKECKAPRKAIVNGECCSLDIICPVAAVADSAAVGSSNGGSLSYGVVIGIVIAAVVVTGLLVGVITFKVTKRHERI